MLRHDDGQGTTLMPEASLEAVGVLHYTEDAQGKRLVVDADPDLAAFYRALMPETMSWVKPRWPPHITVVRAGKDIPIHLEHWGKYEGEEVTFIYGNDMHLDKTYYWLNVWCDRLPEIREELGLPSKSRWTLPPSGGHQCFHMTIANKKFEK